VEAEREKHIGEFEGSCMFYFVVKPDEVGLTVESGVVSIALLKDTGAQALEVVQTLTKSESRWMVLLVVIFRVFWA
jgi:HSP20 family molecular chaperone IbpA